MIWAVAPLPPHAAAAIREMRARPNTTTMRGPRRAVPIPILRAPYLYILTTRHQPEQGNPAMNRPDGREDGANLPAEARLRRGPWPDNPASERGRRTRKCN